MLLKELFAFRLRPVFQFDNLWPGARIERFAVIRYTHPMHYILFYEVADNYAGKRAPFRDAHLDHARQAEARGELVLGGALTDPVDAAVIVFRTRAAAEAFAHADPYVRNGCVTSWRVRDWVTVIGTAL